MNKTYCLFAILVILSTPLFANTKDENQALLQAEYFLIDGDTSAMRSTLEHLQATSISSTIKTRASLRLLSIMDTMPPTKDLKRQYPNQRLVQAIHLKRWLDGISTESNHTEIYLLDSLIQEIQFQQQFPSVFTEEIIQDQIPLSTEQLLALRSPFLDSKKSRYWEFAQAKFKFKLNEYIRAQFLLAAKSALSINPYFSDFHRYFSQLTWYDIHLNHLLHNQDKVLSGSTLESVLTVLDQALASRMTLRKTGLINRKRKQLLNRYIQTHHTAINLFNDQYQKSEEKIWIERIFAIMNSQKGETYFHRQLSFLAGGLVGSLGKKILLEIEKSQVALETSIQAKDTLSIIKTGELLSQQRLAFYNYFKVAKEQLPLLTVPQLADIYAISQQLESGYLEFMDTDTHLHALYLHKTKITFKSIPKSDRLVKALNNLITSFEKPELVLFSSKAELGAFRHSSWTIYHELLAELFQPSPPASLVLVPDGILNAIPFDALRLENISDIKETDTYLVNHCSISYYPSASFFQQHNQASHILGFDQLAIFAPAYMNLSNQSKYFNLRDLPGTRSEANAIKKYFTVKSFVGKEATKQRFISHPFNEKTLVHLAMHGSTASTGNKSAQLIFSGEGSNSAFHESELLQLVSTPSAIVLNACETAKGIYTPGEGLGSLSQEFFQLGTRSIIACLYRIEDKVAKQIMENFYQALRSKKASNLALSLAKRQYLRKADPIYAHPVFWAGMVMQGQAFAYVN